MQIVIDIPKKSYEDIRRADVEHPIFKAIKNGTPLPKGHGRLIDISEYEDKYFNVAITFDDGNHIHEKYTKTIPTIIDADKESGNGEIQ